MRKSIIGSILLCGSVFAFAEDVPIEGTVESKCVVTSDTSGVYGNPNPYTLSTTPSDGGVHPVVRYDVIVENYYKAIIEYPDAFSSSPGLDDTLTCTGNVLVDQHTDADMSDYDSEKVTYNNVTEVTLDHAGSTWFRVENEVEYGGGTGAEKSLPAGNYTGIVTAECIAL